MPGGELVAGNRSIQVDAGEFLRDAKSIGELVVGVKAGKPVYLQDVAKIEDGALPAAKFVWHGVAVRMPLNIRPSQLRSQKSQAKMRSMSLLP
jgi:multidrug efflux pump subunit AcrB